MIIDDIVLFLFFYLNDDFYDDMIDSDSQHRELV